MEREAPNLAERHPSQVRISDLIVRDPVVIGPGHSVVEAVQVLAAYDIGGLPVVDGTGRLVGVVSQTDLVHLWASAGGDWRDRRIEDVMSTPALTIYPAATVQEAAELMTDRNVARLVVIDETSGNVVGLLSDSDLVRAVRPQAGP
jgi:CBS domain-containing protein